MQQLVTRQNKARIIIISIYDKFMKFFSVCYFYLILILIKVKISMLLLITKCFQIIINVFQPL